MEQNVIFKNQEEREALSKITDPFKKGCIKSIYMFAHLDTFDGIPNITGQVNFQNGDTEGTQKFKASGMAELLIDIYNFCQSLEN